MRPLHFGNELLSVFVLCLDVGAPVSAELAVLIVVGGKRADAARLIDGVDAAGCILAASGLGHFNFGLRHNTSIIPEKCNANIPKKKEQSEPMKWQRRAKRGDGRNYLFIRTAILSDLCDESFQQSCHSNNNTTRQKQFCPKTHARPENGKRESRTKKKHRLSIPSPMTCPATGADTNRRVRRLALLSAAVLGVDGSSWFNHQRWRASGSPLSTWRCGLSLLSSSVSALPDADKTKLAQPPRRATRAACVVERRDKHAGRQTDRRTDGQREHRARETSRGVPLHSHSPTHSLTLTHTHSLNHPHTHTLSFSLPHTPSLTLSLVRSFGC